MCMRASVLQTVIMILKISHYKGKQYHTKFYVTDIVGFNRNISMAASVFEVVIA